MRRQKTNPIILLAALLALAIGTWWQRDDAAERRALPETVPATAETATRPVEAPAPRSTARTATAAEDTRLTEPDRSGLESVVPDDVERAELEKTLALIARGGPYPHRQDGSVFMNREGRLPGQPRGYYHEYTVRTPGARNRGARRVVRGDGGETYYTRDHYKTFIRLDERQVPR
jgi:ribonuclease T1